MITEFPGFYFHNDQGLDHVQTISQWFWPIVRVEAIMCLQPGSALGFRKHASSGPSAVALVI